MTGLRIQIRSGLVAHAAIAGILGAALGAWTGMWASYRAAPSIPVDPLSVTEPVKPLSVTEPVKPLPLPAGQAAAALPPEPAAAAALAPRAVASTDKPVGSTGDSADWLERARSLARRPDVTALLTMRNAILQHATERGEADTPATRRQLDELDRNLADARLLQLKKDALEFQRGASKSADRQ